MIEATAAPASSVIYEARYTWRSRAFAMSAFAASFLGWFATTSLLGPIPWPGRALVGAVALLTAVTAVLSVRGGRVAVRVDADGILLSGSSIRYRRHLARIPWADVVAVELWHEESQPPGMSRWIGVRRVEGAPPLPWNPRGRTDHARLRSGRPVSYWSLDGWAFLEAVRANAPRVKVDRAPRFRL